MIQQAPSWDELRTFVEVSRDGSLSGAARRPSLTQPTVGRHIDALEAALEADAVHPIAARSGRRRLRRWRSRRMSKRWRPPRLLGRGRRLEQPAADRGAVRVTASDIMGGCEVLPPILAAFHAAHPGIAIELALSGHHTPIWPAATPTSPCAWC